MINPISEYLKGAIKQGMFPSATYAIGKGPVDADIGALGYAVVEPEFIRSNVDTVYDLASLTKPLVVGLLWALLLEREEADIDDKVSRYFPEFDFDWKKQLTLKHLFTHTSGMPAWRPFYLFEERDSPQKNVFSQIVETPCDYNPGEKVVYSDFNFLLLGMMIEKILGESLDSAARRMIIEPLELSNTEFNPPLSKRNSIAASERGNKYEKMMCGQMFPGRDLPENRFRKETIWGEVHDGNCFYLGGVAGHAGLFSNAKETIQIARQFIAETSVLLDSVTCSLFRKNLTPGLNQARSLAFQLAETEASSAGSRLSKDSFGHLGFTGTSLWIDAEKNSIFLLLTNRTHGRELPFADLGEVRKTFNTLGSEFLGN